MPIYEYRCKICHQVFEEWCKHVEDGDVSRVCPICKGEAKRLISNTSFALKGEGWYVTEYGNRKGKEKSTVPASTPAATEAGTASTASPASPAPSSDSASTSSS